MLLCLKTIYDPLGKSEELSRCLQAPVKVAVNFPFSKLTKARCDEQWMVAVKFVLWTPFLQNETQDGIKPHVRDVSCSSRQTDEEKNCLSAIAVQKLQHLVVDLV